MITKNVCFLYTLSQGYFNQSFIIICSHLKLLFYLRTNSSETASRYKIMQLCWQPPTLRPSIQKISALLRYLHDNRDVQSETFEARWNALQPPATHNMHQAPAHSIARFENDFASDDFSGNCSCLNKDFVRNHSFSF